MTTLSLNIVAVTEGITQIKSALEELKQSLSSGGIQTSSQELKNNLLVIAQSSEGVAAELEALKTKIVALDEGEAKLETTTQAIRMSFSQLAVAGDSAVGTLERQAEAITSASNAMSQMDSHVKELATHTYSLLEIQKIRNAEFDKQISIQTIVNSLTDEQLIKEREYTAALAEQYIAEGKLTEAQAANLGIVTEAAAAKKAALEATAEAEAEAIALRKQGLLQLTAEEVDISLQRDMRIAHTQGLEIEAQKQKQLGLEMSNAIDKAISLERDMRIAHTQALEMNSASSVAAARVETEAAAAAANNLHDAMRGAAGASGALWTTYGAMIPLLTAFATVAVGIKEVKFGAEFEDITKYTDAVAKATGDVSVNIEDLRSRLLEIKNVVNTPEQLAGSIKEMVKSGQTEADALKDVSTLSKAATVAQEDLALITKTTANQYLAWNEQLVGTERGLSSLSQGVNMISYAALASATDFAGFSTMLGQTSSMATATNASFSELLAALATLSNMGIKASTASTSLRTSLVRLEAPTGKAGEILEAMGFSAYDAEGKMKGLVSIFDDLSKVLKGLNDEDMTTVLMDIFKLRSMEGGIAVLNAMKKSVDEGKFSLVGMEEQIRQVGKSMDFVNKTFSELSVTTKGQMAQMLADIHRALTESFDGAAVGYFMAQVRAAAEDGSLRVIAEGAAKLVGMFVEVIATAVKYREVVEGLLAAYAFSKVVAGINTVVVSIEAMIAAETVAASVSMANPYIALAAAAVAVGVATYSYFDKATEGTTKLKEHFDTLEESTSKIKGDMDGANQSFGVLLASANAPAAKEGLLENIKNFLAAPVISTETQKVMDFFSKLWGGVVSVSSEGGDWETDTSDKIGKTDVLTDAINYWGGKLKPLLDSGKEARARMANPYVLPTSNVRMALDENWDTTPPDANGNDYPNYVQSYGSIYPDTTKGGSKSRTLTDAEKDKIAKEREKELQVQDYYDQLQYKQAEAASANELKIQEKYIKDDLSLLDAQHSAGLVAEDDYTIIKLDLLKERSDKEIAAAIADQIEFQNRVNIARAAADRPENYDKINIQKKADDLSTQNEAKLSKISELKAKATSDEISGSATKQLAIEKERDAIDALKYSVMNESEKEIAGLEQSKNKFQESLQLRVTAQKITPENAQDLQGRFDTASAQEYSKILDKIVKVQMPAVTSFADPIAAGITKAAEAVNKLNTIFDEQAKKYKKMADEKAALDALEASPQKDRDLKTYYEHLDELNIQSTQQQLYGYSQVASAASKMFSENTKGREALSGVEKALGYAEMALEAEKIGKKVWGYAETAMASTASTAVENANNMSVAETGAIASITAQGSIPYVGFAMVAAMAALMASVLARGGGSLGGVESSEPPVTALGTGTVLGDKSKVSESTKDAYAEIEKYNHLEYIELQGIHDSMKQLNTNITGLVNSVVRGTDFSTGTGLPSNTDSVFKSYFSSVSAGIEKTLSFGIDGMAGKIISFLSGSFLFTSTNAIVGWLASGIFGGGTSYEYAGAGVKMDPISVNQLAGGQSANVQNYQTTKIIEDGGWFSSDDISYSTQYQKASAETTKLFTDVFSSMSKTLLTLTEGLGGDVNKALTEVFEIPITNLQGKTGDEINTLITGVISAAGDTAIKDVLGSIVSMYQQVGEGLLETATRLFVGKEVVSNILWKTNQKMTGDLLEASQAMITMSGGLDKLTENANKYMDVFFNSPEKQSFLYATLKQTLDGMGMALPQSIDGMRLLVEGLDLTTTAGQQAYTTLMEMSGSIGDYIDAISKVMDPIQEVIDNSGLSDYAKNIRDINKQYNDYTAILQASGAVVSDYTILERARGIALADAAKAAGYETQSLIDKWITPITDSWKKFFEQMTVSSLAPSVSAESEQALYNKYKAAATDGQGNDQQDVSAFQNFITGEYLPFWQKYNGGETTANYAQVFSSVMADTRDVASKITIDTSQMTQDLIAAIKLAFADVHLEQPLTITLDGRTLATAVTQVTAKYAPIINTVF